jgi:hypothetical protein
MEFIRAYFSNNERTIVKAIYANDKGEEIPHIITAEDGNPKWEELKKHISIDDLHEATYKWIREANESYKEKVMEIAKERGMLIDIDAANTDEMKALLGIIFEEPKFEKPSDERKHKEKLFALKLALFEFDSIKESKDRDLKTKLRKSENMVDAMYIGLQLARQKD